MVEQKISLDFTKNGVQRTVHARQGENASRDILVSLTANGEPADISETTIKVIYPDGTHSVLETRNPVKVTIPQPMCVEVGEKICELQVTHGTELLYSPQFRVLVEGTILGASGSSEPIGNPTLYEPLIATAGDYTGDLGTNAKIPVYDPAKGATKLADPAVLQPDVTELEERLDAIGDTLGGVVLQLPGKVDKEQGKGLSTNDYTNADKAKVGSLATVATTGSYNDLSDKPTIPEQLQSDWNQSDTTAKDFIKNKPNITAPVQPDWSESDSTALDYIKNKPTIPNIAVIEMTWGITDFATVLTCGEIKALVNAGKTLIGRYRDPNYPLVTAYVFIAYVEFNADTGGFIQCYADHTLGGALDPHFLTAETDADVMQG